MVAEPPVIEPPPEATAKVTATPDTGLLFASVTSTLGAMATAVPTVADWLLPAFRVILVGGLTVVIPALVPVQVGPLLVAMTV